MIRISFGLLALLALVPALQALDKPKTPSPTQQYRDLLQEFNKAMQEYRKAAQAAKTPEDRGKVFQEKYPKPDKYAKSFLELAERNPKDPAALDALVWVVSNSNGVVTSSSTAKSDLDSPRSKAIKILLRDHVKSEKLAGVCQQLGFAQDEDSQKLLHAILEKNPHASVQAQACLALAQQEERDLRLARRLKGDSDLAKRYEGFMGKERVEKLVKADIDKLNKEVEGYYERIIKDFAKESTPRSGTMGKLAERKLEALRHPILVGKPAPEIEGEDVDGAKFKLSDYRGKVVLLDFWGNW